MELSIVGAGAMGLLWAWRLERSGHKVHLLCRNESAVRAIADGVKLTYRGKEEGLAIDASSDPRIVLDSRYVFLWVKSYDTREAASSIAPHLTKNQTIVTLQNGIGNAELLAEACPQAGIIAGTTTAAAYLEGGTLHAVSLGETTLGLLPDRNTREPRRETGLPARKALGKQVELVELLCRAGLASYACSNVTQAIWEKAAVNAAINPISALLEAKNGELLGKPSVLALQKAIIKETVQVAAILGLTLDPDALAARVQSVCGETSSNYSSMLMDVRRGSKTEIDALNGAIASIAEQCGGGAPVNKTITALIHALEARSPGK